MEGEGRNITEAKRDAGAKIEHALSGDYCPTIIQAHGEAVLIYREPKFGWTYLPIHPDTQGRLWRNVSNEWTRDEAERRARQHLAQIIFSHDGPDGSEVICNKNDREEHKRWAAWQRLYKKWRDTGASDQVAHENACRGREPEAVNPAGSSGNGGG
jgi:hypothetical protein